MGRSRRTASKAKAKPTSKPKPAPKPKPKSKGKSKAIYVSRITRNPHEEETSDPRHSNYRSNIDTKTLHKNYGRGARDLVVTKDGEGSHTTMATAADSSHETKSSRSTYAPTSGTDPYARKLNASEKRAVVQKEVEGSVIYEGDSSLEPQPNLLDKFFPNDGDGRRILDQLGDYFATSSGWTDWPDNSCRNEGEITDAFVPLFNSVANLLGVEGRVAIDRQNNPIKTRDDGWLKPDVFVRGDGSPAFPPVLAPIFPRTQRKKEREQEDEDDSTYGKETPPAVEWDSCAIPVEIKTEHGKSPNDIFQLGTYVRETFVAQPNRRFMPSLLLTESHIQFMLWDRAGVLVSERLNYHSHPERFCDILVHIVKCDEQELGFDPSIFYRDRNLHIKTDSDLYVVKETLFRSYTILGRGSTSWRVRKIDDEDKYGRYVILDSWVPEGASTESSILTEMEKLRVDNRAMGLPPFIGSEAVQLGTDHPDTVHLNRHGWHVENCVDLVHSRSVVRWNGRRLENHSGLKELFGGLRDAIDVHGKVYEKTGILHGDISPWNIVLQPPAQDMHCPRAALIDFTQATLPNERTLAARPQFTPGALFYVPVGRLRLHLRELTYLDELEGFYWVLIFMLTLYAGNGIAYSRDDWPEAVERLKAHSPPASISVKVGHFQDYLDELSLYNQLDLPSQRLMENLYDFFRKRTDKIRQNNDMGTANSTADYSKVIGYFEQAIREVGTPIVYVHANDSDDDSHGEDDPELIVKAFCLNGPSDGTGEEVVQVLDMALKNAGATYFA